MQKSCRALMKMDNSRSPPKLQISSTINSTLIIWHKKLRSYAIQPCTWPNSLTYTDRRLSLCPKKIFLGPSLYCLEYLISITLVPLLASPEKSPIIQQAAGYNMYILCNRLIWQTKTLFHHCSYELIQRFGLATCTSENAQWSMWGHKVLQLQPKQSYKFKQYF